MIENIILFVKLVEVGSFSKLAQIVKISQPTISRRIKSLEAETGHELFIRTTSAIRLTESGRDFYRKCRHLDGYLNNLLSDISNNESTFKGQLRVALPGALSQNIIFPYLANFLEQYPQLNLSIYSPANHVDIIREAFDMAVTTTVPNSANCIIKLLHTFHIHLYTSSNYLKTHKSINSIEQALNQQQLGLVSTDGKAITKLLVKNLKTGDETNLPLKNISLCINDASNVKQLIYSDKMLITAWDSLLEDGLATGEIVKILPDYSFGQIKCYLVRPSAECTKVQRAFADFIEKCFNPYKQPIRARPE